MNLNTANTSRMPGMGDYERFPNTGDPRDPRNDYGDADEETITAIDDVGDDDNGEI